jgi:hypothetical protein
MKLQAPKGLSRRARRTWATLTDAHTFEGFELVTFTRALKWWDVSDAFYADAMTATGKDRAALLKLSMDANSSALRCWRTLRFPVPAGVRRPGRPSGANWSTARKVAAGA